MEQYLMQGERLDDLQLGGLHIIQKPGEFLFGTDSVLLAHWVKSCKRVLDLGTGNGILPLLLYGHRKPEYICGMEIQPTLADRAKRSMAMNGLQAHIEIICADYTNHSRIPHLGSYDTVVANPPYAQPGSGDMSANRVNAAARNELDTTLHHVAAASCAALKQGGRLYMVHRPERLADIFAALAANRLQPKALQAVQHQAGKPPRMVLLRAVKDGKSGLDMLPPLILHNEDGSHTAELAEIYRPR